MKAVFLDRDGTLIKDAEYPSDPSKVELVPGTVSALRKLKDRGFRLAIISNQSGIGRGIVTEEEAAAVHERTAAVLAEQGITLDAVRYCPHAPDAGCTCRKPSPQMIVDAAREIGVQLDHSYMIGDKQSDVQAGHAAGARTILLLANGVSRNVNVEDETQEHPQWRHAKADFEAKTWMEAAAFMLSEE